MSEAMGSSVVRRAYVRMSPDMIISLLQAERIYIRNHDGRLRMLTSTLPKDVRALRGWVTNPMIGTGGDVFIVVEGESLAPIAEGAALPEIRVLATETLVSPPYVAPDPDDGSVEP